MKQIIKLISIATTAVVFTACGGGGSGSNTTAGANGNPPAGGGGSPFVTTAMVLNQAMPIDVGTKIINSSEDAKVNIVVIGTDKTATLLVGSADLQTPRP